MRVGQGRPLPGSASHALYPIPQRVVQHFRFGVADALDLLQIGDAGSLDRRNGLEVCQQGGAGLFSHAGNGRQRGSVGALFHRALAVIVGVAVRFVLNIRHKGKDIAVVMPSGNNRFYVNNVNGKDYFSFIADELINNCETWFNISRNPEDRYIAGMSMGGYGAFYAALKRPKQYNTAFSYSGLLNLIERYDNPQGIDMYPVFGTREELIDNNFDLYSLFNKKGTDDSKFVDNPTKFIIACGLQDPRLHMSKDFYKEAKEAGLNVSMYEQDGGHEWDYWDKCIEQTIKCIAGEDSKWQ